MSDITGGAVTQPGVNVNELATPDRLHSNAVGLIGVLFLTLTGSAPITAMLLNVPIVVGNGNGIGSPAAFMVATIILLVFSVGYAAMAGKVTAAGGFYSFISHGLGRELGMAMAFGSVVAYAVFEPSLCGGFAYFMNLKLMQLFHVNVPWPALALGMVALIAVLTYFDIKVSSAVLGVALVGEIIILVVFDAGMFAHNGSGVTIQAAALNPVAAFQGFPAHNKLAAGAAGIGLFFAFWSWVGFEMAPNYAEESKDPKRIVPLSLYISVLFLGVLYTITCWAAQSGFGGIDGAISEAQNSSATFFFDSADKFVGGWVGSLMSYLILTGSFACGMAFHNTTSRYLYSMGRERILPAALARTHVKYKTPYNASFTQSVIAALIIIAFAVFVGSGNPTVQAYGQLYGLMALLGTILILSAQAIVSIAVVVYFRKEHPEDHHWWTTLIAPILAFLAQAYVVYLCISNMAFLGGGFAFAPYIPWIDLIVVGLGLAYAFYVKKADPAKFDNIGRFIFHGN